jgi:hypothetical protein
MLPRPGFRLAVCLALLLTCVTRVVKRAGQGGIEEGR